MRTKPTFESRPKHRQKTMNENIFSRANILDYFRRYQSSLIVVLAFLTPVISWTHGVEKSILLSSALALIWQPLAFHAWWSDRRINRHHNVQHPDVPTDGSGGVELRDVPPRDPRCNP